MTLSAPQLVSHARSRFGLGARSDVAAPSDPVGWLVSQVDGPDPAPVAGMPSLSDCLSYRAAFGGKTAAQQLDLAHQAGALFVAEQQAFLANAVTSTSPFRERLVQFWTNHFADLSTNFISTVAAGSFVRDAIRPYVNGNFADMLAAVIQHPAMISSLDNSLSVGPASRVAQAAARINSPQLAPPSINENLGRETLELYTVGVASGFTQGDVDAMSYLLTGFTYQLNTAPYGFFYDANWAQPGRQTLLGNSYPNTQAGCIAALRDLANNPFTYLHLATKLVTHFASDTPATSDIATIAGVLSQTGGNLGAAAKAIVALPSAWIPFTKVRTPQDLVVAALRAGAVTAANMPAVAQIVGNMGQPVWKSPFPNGWSDLAADWTGPLDMMIRADCMASLAASMTGVSPMAVANAVLGPFLTPATASAMAAAKSPRDQLTLLFCSPEFQRR